MVSFITNIVTTVARSLKRAIMWTLGLGPDWMPDARSAVTILFRIGP